MSPAARINDFHICPQFRGPVPHVGGAILQGSGTVFIGGVPAARVGDSCICTGVGEMDSITVGSNTVFIENKPAARVGDTTSHGGKIILGCFSVFIGG